MRETVAGVDNNGGKRLRERTSLSIPGREERGGGVISEDRIEVHLYTFGPLEVLLCTRYRL
jgi:hypothetical protein